METVKSQSAITRVLTQLELKEAEVKALYTEILVMKKQWQEVKREIRMLVMKLPMEVARERHRQKVLASKRAWWAKKEAEKRTILEERKLKKKRESR